MLLEELQHTINQIISENPQAGKYPVILPADDEGNSFREAYFAGVQKYFDMGDMNLLNNEDVEKSGEYEDDYIQTLVPVFCF